MRLMTQYRNTIVERMHVKFIETVTTVKLNHLSNTNSRRQIRIQ